MLGLEKCAILNRGPAMRQTFFVRFLLAGLGIAALFVMFFPVCTIMWTWALYSYVNVLAAIAFVIITCTLYSIATNGKPWEVLGG